MTNLGDLTFSRGDVIRSLTTQKRSSREGATRPPMARTTLRSGAFRILESARLIVAEGGGVVVEHDGTFTALRPEGTASVQVGSISHTINAEPVGHGLRVYDLDGGVLASVLRELDENGDTGRSVVEFGDSTNPADHMRVYAGDVRLQAPGGVYVDHDTTGNGANCHITEDGLIQRSTSSERYKQDIEDFDVDSEAVLNLRPKMWRDRSDVQQRPDTAKHHVGFIAEEVDSVGLGEFVERNSNGEIESVEYGKLTAALVALCQSQQAQIDDLAVRVNDLERKCGP